MQNKVKIAVIALCYSPLAFAQTSNTEQNTAKVLDENAFTFTEAQLGEDDDMSQNITILGSNNNVYASEVGYLFSPVRFRYRAFNQKYNDVYINGAPVNDMESGQFRFSNVGGLNRFTRNQSFVLPFESNNFAFNGMAGSNNYDFRAGNAAAGQYASIAAANRNYTLRGMYTYGSGFNEKGWAIAAGITYRWANHGYVEGTFYNSLSYFFGVEKKWTNGHSLSFTTWGNPTERSSQGAATDEAYWLANDYYYNPYWGYQNGHKRNSRVVNDFAPTALFTWDWDIDDNHRLTTTLLGKYSHYKSTKLNYSNSENPQPDYWKNLPSSYYEVWDGDIRNNQYSLDSWQRSVDFWHASKANRQINWDRLYAANKANAAMGGDALYFVQAKNSDVMNLTLASTIATKNKNNTSWNAGFILSTNSDRHYQTMEDMLGASSYHNTNSYALGNYSAMSDAVQYDLNTMGPNRLGKLIYEGDVFGYNYRIYNHKGIAWANFGANLGRWHLMAAGKLGGNLYQRNGYMRNGMFADNSFGKSKIARMGEGGAKGSATFNAGRGHVFQIGIGYEWKAPIANTVFVSPEMNNDYVLNLKDEHVLSSEFSYKYSGSWLQASVNAYFSYIDHATEWQNFFFDDINSFSYVSMTGIKKKYYGVEAGMKFKLAPYLDLKTLGTISDARYVNNANVWYMSSTSANYNEQNGGASEKVMNKNMRESGTPLTAGSIGLSFHQSGWYIDLNANYYDRIYLSYSPSMRYESTLRTAGYVDNDGNYIIPDQAKGHGGWMVDGSIGKSLRLKKGSLNFNLMVTNILNNQKIVTGGYEQSRSDYTTTVNAGTDTRDRNNNRIYKFSKNPKKYYVFGTNGMLQISYRF